MNLNICCIARNEEMTITDWVEYHRNIGVNHIYIFDNNDIGDDSLERKLKIYVDIGYVSILNIFKGCKGVQMQCYNLFINKKFNDGYWTAFIDCDEYISISDDSKTLDEILKNAENKCEKIGVLYVNWICYTASKKILYEPKPVIERFQERLDDINKKNNHIKSIVKNGCHVFFQTPHNAIPIDDYKVYNMSFNVVNKTPLQDFEENQDLYIKHYPTKSVQEYIYRKYGQCTADAIGRDYYNFDFFMEHNNYDKYYNKPFKEILKLMKNE